MKLDRFLTNFNTSGAGKEKYIKEHIKKDYVSYADKISDCERIARACHYHEVDGKSRFRLNSPASAMMFALVMVGRYTNIELEYSIDEYDELQKCGALGMIIGAIPEMEYDEYSTVMHMVEEDFVFAETDVASKMEDLKNAIGIVLASYVKALSDSENLMN